MSQTKSFSIPRATVATTSASDKFFPATDWGLTGKIVEARCLELEVCGLFGAASVAVGYQTCNDRTAPDAAVTLLSSAVGGYATADGTYDPPAGWATMSAAANKKEIRFGYIIKTGGAIGGASVEGKFQLGY